MGKLDFISHILEPLCMFLYEEAIYFNYGITFIINFEPTVTIVLNSHVLYIY